MKLTTEKFFEIAGVKTPKQLSKNDRAISVTIEQFEQAVSHCHDTLVRFGVEPGDAIMMVNDICQSVTEQLALNPDQGRR